MKKEKPWFKKFKKDYQGKKVLIMGLGLLGRGVSDAKFFNHIGSQITITDLKSKKELELSLKQLKGLTFNYVLGQHRKSDFLSADLILRNAAVPYNSPFLAIAREHNIPIEMDEALFMKYAPVKTIGVTGTRGKSTTATLIYKLLRSADLPVWLGGNILGKATLPLLEKINEDDWLVMELSSWQLQGFKKIKLSPHIAVLTNIYEDHLNRYKNMANYIADKKLIFKYQTKKDFLIVNQSLKEKKLFRNTKAKIIPFSAGDISLEILKKVKLKGSHNLENIAAMLKVALLLKIEKKIINKVVANFMGLDFRLQKIAVIDGVDYINDTTSTTPIAGIKALKSFKKPIILIAGGASKNLNMKNFASEIVRVVKGVIFLEGAETNSLQNLINKNGKKELILGRFNQLKKALQLARKKAIAGDVILFSPGCASFGMFKNEFDRGQQFNNIVKSFKK